MHLTTRLLIGIVAVVSCEARSVGAQSLPGTNLTVTARVRDVTMSHDTTTISYSLLSDIGSLERLMSFKVKLAMTPTVVVVPGPDSEWVVRKLFSGITGASWVALAGIGAGDSTPTLTLKAIGLPGIVTAWYYGDSLTTIDGSDSASVANAVPHNRYSELSKTIQTVGVETAPTTLAAMISRLHTLTDSSCVLSWITDGGLCTVLGGHLAASPSRLIAYTTVLDSARSHGSAVTDAAYYMLKANAEYMKAFPDTSTTTLVTTNCSGSRGKWFVHNFGYGSFGITYSINGGTTQPLTVIGRTDSLTNQISYNGVALSVPSTVNIFYNGAAFRTASCP